MVLVVAQLLLHLLLLLPHLVQSLFQVCKALANHAGGELRVGVLVLSGQIVWSWLVGGVCRVVDRSAASVFSVLRAGVVRVCAVNWGSLPQVVVWRLLVRHPSSRFQQLLDALGLVREAIVSSLPVGSKTQNRLNSFLALPHPLLVVLDHLQA